MYKKSVYFLFILFISTSIFAQPVKITFSGKLSSSDIKNKKNIYYALKGDKFSSKRVITYDADLTYKFDLSKTVYKKATSGELVFALDSTSSTNDENSCVHRMDISEIYNYAISKKRTAINIKTDLVMGFLCSSSVLYGAEGEAKKFVGNYKKVSGDTVFVITLHDNFNRYRSEFYPTHSDLTNEESGSWLYDPKAKILAINVEYRINRKFGIIILSQKPVKYKVITKPDGFELESLDGSKITRKKSD